MTHKGYRIRDMEPAILNKAVSSSGKLTSCFVDAYNFFNKELFNSELSESIIFNFVRKRRNHGYFMSNCWIDGDDNVISEISINPDSMFNREVKEVFSTLVHEMCHLWQMLYGKPSKGNYHNGEFAKKMEDIGLMTSQSGMPEGKRTGSPMTHYIVEDGKFDKAFTIIKDVKIPFIGIPDPGKEKPKGGYVKFICPNCDTVFRGNKNIRASCVPCSSGEETVEFEIE